MRPESPLDSLPLVQFLSENLILVVIIGLAVLWLITRILGLTNGPSGSGGDGGGWGDGGGE